MPKAYHFILILKNLLAKTKQTLLRSPT